MPMAFGVRHRREKVMADIFIPFTDLAVLFNLDVKPFYQIGDIRLPGDDLWLMRWLGSHLRQIAAPVGSLVSRMPDLSAVSIHETT